MLKLALQVLILGVYLQVATGSRPCDLFGSVANCMSSHHYWVPALPPYITHLFLELNHISEINDTSLSGLEELQNLDLGMQHIQRSLVIRNNAFRSQRNLTRLVLSGTSLRLEPNAFAGLSNLRNLYLGYCSLGESILEDSYLQPLLSLETLDLRGNQLRRLRPAQFFLNLTHFTELDLKLNKIQSICEEDLIGFRGKHFRFLNLESNNYGRLYPDGFDWERCGNPFRGMSFEILDMSTNSFSADKARQFFNAIEGTKIGHLTIRTKSMGKGFSHDNIPDPDRRTFEGLQNSSVGVLDLSQSRIFSLQQGVFSPLKEAIIIDVSQNKINQINRNAFDGLQGNLRLLNLSHNLLGEIYSHTFAQLTDLRVLDLSYNHIGALGYKSFSGLPNLRLLDLTRNSLRDLGFPASLPHLEYLWLDGNNLQSLYGLDKFAGNSIELDIRNNRLTNLEDVYDILIGFVRLRHLFYGGNFIRWCTRNRDIPVPRSNSLEKLNLDRSSLQTVWAKGTCLDLFDHLENLIILSLSLNSLQSLPQDIFKGLTSVTTIDLSFNSLTYLQPDVFPKSLKILDLSNNFLASPDPATFHSLSFLNLMMNPFLCDCNLASFLTWANGTNVTLPSPIMEFRCEFPLDLYNVSLLEYSRTVELCEEDDESTLQDLRFALFVTCSALLILTVAGAIAYARLRGQIFIIYKKVIGRVLEGPQAATPADDPRYDAYLCFSNNDYKWVEDALLKKLDAQFAENNILRLCFEARDFLPGEDHLSNVRDAVWGSRKTVCIVTKEFLKDGWCLEAFMLAQGRMLEELTDVLIVVVVGRVPHYRLMKYEAVRTFIQKREYLIWPEDAQDLEWFYERLVSKVLKHTKVKKAPTDPKEDAPGGVQPEDENGIQLENEDGIELRDVRTVEA